MLIDFSKMEPMTEHNFRGGLNDIFTCAQAEEAVKIIRGTIPKGASIGMHTHTTDFEVMYIISGKAESTLDGVKDTLLPGMCQYCPQGHSHDLVNVGNEDLVFLGVVPKAV